MTTSLLQKLVLTPVLISATVFTILSIPLAIFGKQPVTIQLQEEPVFSGQLREISTPYLGMAAVLSLGAGFATVAVAGWHRSSHKSSLVEAKLLAVTKNLQQKETQLEALQLSDLQLKAFVDQPLPQQSLDTVSASPATPIIEPLIIKDQSFFAQEALSDANTQAILNYPQAKPISVNSLPQAEMELHAQLEEIMTSVQVALRMTATVRASEVTEVKPAKTTPAAPSWVVKDTVF